MDKLHHYGLVRLNLKTGKIDTIMTAIGKGMIKLWGLQNTNKNMASVVVDIDERSTIIEYLGTDTGFPEIHKTEGEFIFELPQQLYEIFDEEVAKRSAG